jgi:carbonic anhydrase/SulP family sulfate permease
MTQTKVLSLTTFPRDLTAGLVVFLVALPLCLGVALASGAPLFSGLLAGIIGGVIVGSISQSHTSVSGPAAGLTAIVAAQITQLGSFENFLLAVFVAGLIQIVLGCARAGGIAALVPSGVIKGLLAAIGLILVLKQIPHLLGHDTDPEDDMSFAQPDHENTFTELVAMLGDVQFGAAVIGILSLAVLLIWNRSDRLKNSIIPAPLVVIILGVGLNLLFRQLGGRWLIESSHLVQVPVMKNLTDVASILRMPDFTSWKNPAIYTTGIMIAVVASLETLLNLEATDKLDPRKRTSPPNRELIAQGLGNVMCGLIGGLPVTSVIVRSSVNLNAGGKTKLATIVHGILLLVCVALLPTLLNQIPLSCLAAILIVTGMKLASPTLVREMWNEGRYQFLPFMLTVISIVLTDLLIGILIGLGVCTAFVVYSSLRRPLSCVIEKRLSDEVLHIELANQVSFLNRAALDRTLKSIPRGGHVLLDATSTVYIDPDILSLLREFKEKTAPVRGVIVSLRGFREKYRFNDEIHYEDYATRELQHRLTPQQVLQILIDGNERFLTGRRLTRDFGRQLNATAHGQHPIAVILSCIDSRAPAELIFDLGLGDIFSVRVAGNVISQKVLGSIEYACAVAGAKLVLVTGHTRCGAVTAAVSAASSSSSVTETTGCKHLEPIVRDIQLSLDSDLIQRFENAAGEAQAACVDEVARRNVARSVTTILEQSQTLSDLVKAERIAVIGAMYDVTTGKIDFLPGGQEVG